MRHPLLFSLLVLALGLAACEKEGKVASGGGPAPVQAPSPDPDGSPDPSPSAPASEVYAVYNDAGGNLADPNTLLFTGGGLVITEITGDATEGSKFLRSTNAGPGAFWGITIDRNGIGRIQDLSSFSSGALRFDIRVNRAVAANERLIVNVTDGADVTRTVQLTPAVGFDPAKLNQWQSVSIPISSYAGVDLARIKVPFAIAVDSPPGTPALTIDNDNVRWEK